MASIYAPADHISIVDWAMENVNTDGIVISSPATLINNRTNAPRDKCPDKKNPAAPSLYCAVIIKQVDEKTRSKTSINDLLRD